MNHFLHIGLGVGLFTAWANAAEPAGARWADRFVSSIGISTQISALSGTRFDTQRALLLELGVRHIRFSGTSPAHVAFMQDMAANGVQTLLFADTPQGLRARVESGPAYWTGTLNAPASYDVDVFIADVLGPGVVSYVESHNELDFFFAPEKWFANDSTNLSNDPTSPRYWMDYLRAWSRDLYRTLRENPATSHIPIIGPSFGDAQSPRPMGDLADFIDYGNVHAYGSYPEQSLEANMGRMIPVSDDLPIASTENGFEARSPAGTDLSEIPETVQAKHIPRLFAESYRLGMPFTALFALTDFSDATADGSDAWGLTRFADLERKPSFYALTNLISILSDRQATPFEAGVLDYVLEGNAAHVRQLVLQKSSGDYYLLLWNEVPSWEQISGVWQDPNRVANVTLVVRTPIAAATLITPGQSPAGATTQALALTAGRVAIAVPGEIVIVRLVPDTSASPSARFRIFEAEDGSVAQTADLRFGRDRRGVTGSSSVPGVVDFASSSADAVTIPLTVPTTGSRTVRLRYANTAATRSATLSVNGGPTQSVSFPTTGSRNAYSEVTTTLNFPTTSATVTIRNNINQSGVSIDHIAVDTGPAPTWDEPAAPAAVQVQFATLGTAEVTWADTSTEYGYVIERKRSTSNQWERIGAVGADRQAFRDHHVRVGKAYSYRVAAVGPLGLSGWALSGERTSPAGTTVTDDDFALTSSQSSGWTLCDASTSGNLLRDPTVLQRTSNTTQSFTYAVPNIADFRLHTFVAPWLEGSNPRAGAQRYVVIESSGDGSTYVRVPFDTDALGRTQSNEVTSALGQLYLRPAQALPSGSAYIRVSVLNIGSSAADTSLASAIQFGQFRFDVATAPADGEPPHLVQVGSRKSHQ